ncbi:MAG: thioesterase [Polynucleobacter sp. 24-46-87]|nr:MAG: thioesterase [Polynucleobacter sp. 24-46-87]
MKASLKPGIKYEYKFMVTDAQTVPAMYPESKEAAMRPEVFATGFLVGFLELACVKAIELTEVRGKKLIFSVEAYDDVELVSKGSHERIIINKGQFEERTRSKLS